MNEACGHCPFTALCSNCLETPPVLAPFVVNSDLVSDPEQCIQWHICIWWVSLHPGTDWCHLRSPQSLITVGALGGTLSPAPWGYMLQLWTAIMNLRHGGSWSTGCACRCTSPCNLTLSLAVNGVTHTSPFMVVFSILMHQFKVCKMYQITGLLLSRLIWHTVETSCMWVRHSCSLASLHSVLTVLHILCS